MVNATKGVNSLIFNHKLKEKFITDMINNNNINPQTAKTYMRIFILSSRKEFKLNKDLSDFTFNEIEDVLISFNSNNVNTIQSYGRVISSYLNWCESNKIISRNLMSDLKSADFGNYLTNKEKYLTEKELQYIENNCINYQDAVILRLLFEGVSGKSFSEIINLRKTDINEDTNELRLREEIGNTNSFSERIIKVSDRAMFLIIKAMSEKVYYKKNGEMNHHDNINPYTELVDNNFIIRPSITKTDIGNKPVNKHVIYRRIKAIADSLGDGNITSKLIQRSGMLFYAKEIIKDNNKISLDNLKVVASKFNFKSYHNLKGYITIENIKETYGG